MSPSFPFNAQYHQACSSPQVCLVSTGSTPGRELEITGLTAHRQSLVTFSMILALPPAAPSCNTNFSNSPIQGFQTSLSTDYGIVPLPPVTLETEDDATGHRGDDLCSPGSATMVANFLSTYMPENGWTSYSSSAQQQIWKSSSGCIAILIQDPTQWIVSWPNPNIGSPFSDCPT